MKSRKKTWIDGIDREMLRYIYYQKLPPTQRQISLNVGMSPSSVKTRLLNLRRMGIVKRKKSHNKKYWLIDLK